MLGAEHDEGDILIVKSGTDFRDLSEFTLTLEDTPPGSVRRKVIKEIRGTYVPCGRRASTQEAGLTGNRQAPLDAAEHEEERAHREAARVHPLVRLRGA